MKTSTYNTGTKSLLFVVVPKDAYGFILAGHLGTHLSWEDNNPNGKAITISQKPYWDKEGKIVNKEGFKIISTLSNITEEQCKELVKKFKVNGVKGTCYECYHSDTIKPENLACMTALDSILSAIKASKLEVGENEDVLILELN